VPAAGRVVVNPSRVAAQIVSGIDFIGISKSFLFFLKEEILLYFSG
jgi:hypothetical protein